MFTMEYMHALFNFVHTRAESEDGFQSPTALLTATLQTDRLGFKPTKRDMKTPTHMRQETHISINPDCANDKSVQPRISSKTT